MIFMQMKAITFQLDLIWLLLLVLELQLPCLQIHSGLSRLDFKCVSSIHAECSANYLIMLAAILI